MDKTSSSENNQEPQVGIFFVLDNAIYHVSSPISKYEAEEEYIDSDFGHYQFFEYLKKKYQAVAGSGLEYESVPRGRVAYHVKEKTFYIFGDSLLLKQKRTLASLVKDFHLEAERVKIGEDEHYRVVKQWL